MALALDDMLGDLLGGKGADQPDQPMEVSKPGFI